MKTQPQIVYSNYSRWIDLCQLSVRDSPPHTQLYEEQYSAIHTGRI